MTRHSIIAASAFTAIIVSMGSSQAQDTASVHTMKPQHGISFNVADQRAVSYFLRHDGQCKLVLTFAGPVDLDNPSAFTTKRFAADVPAGMMTHYDATEGSSLEIACLQEAQAMSIKVIGKLAAKH